MIGGTVCDVYDPTQYGHSIDLVVEASEKDEDEPLIVVLNEIDTWFNIPKESEDKASNWLTRDIDPRNLKKTSNDLFDKLSLIDNFICICTSNKTFDELDALDVHGTLFRKGRFHIRCELTEPIVDEIMAERFKKVDSKEKAREGAIGTLYTPGNLK